MKMMKCLLPLAATLVLAACQTYQPQPYDYTAFKESNPKSILVLPPLNESPDVKATWGMLTATTFPLSEAGYYVFPVAVAAEVFKQNGLTNAADIHDVKLDKLHSIFGHDAVLYVTVKEYGTKYQVLQSVTTVRAEAKLVDAHTGKELWSGSAVASDAGQKSNNNILAALLGAIIDQVVGTLGDKGYDMAQTAGVQLLSPAKHNGILHGPRSPHYQKEPGQR